MPRLTLLAILALTAALAEPPPGDWELVFRDEFEGDRLDPAVWASQAGPSGHILSSRWPENAKVEGGLLRLLTRKERRGGQEWTTGNVWVRDRHFSYGYYEARYRYGAAPGLNNAFWLTRDAPAATPGRLELDINEGHHPADVAMTLHLWGDGPANRHLATSQTYHAPGVDLSRDFHVYGCDWSEAGTVFYLDGQPIHRLANTIAYGGDMRLLFSSAVIRWAGPVTDALDGTSMDVDWVRVWRSRGPHTPDLARPTPPDPPLGAPAAPTCDERFETTAPGALPPGWVALRGEPAVEVTTAVEAFRLTHDAMHAWDETTTVSPLPLHGTRRLAVPREATVALPFPAMERVELLCDVLRSAPWSDLVIAPCSSRLVPAKLSADRFAWVPFAGPYVGWGELDYLRLYHHDAWQTFDPVPAGRWVRLRLLADVKAGRADLYADDRWVGGGPFRAPQPDLGWLVIAHRAGDFEAGPVRVDNVQVRRPGPAAP